MGGFRLRVHESLPSTQSLLTELAERGEPAGLAIMARRQTAGRGRAGRPWQSQAGNLHISVLLRPGGPGRDIAGYALLAAVALHDAALHHAAGRDLRLKWPNDLMDVVRNSPASSPKPRWMTGRELPISSSGSA